MDFCGTDGLIDACMMDGRNELMDAFFLFVLMDVAVLTLADHAWGIWQRETIKMVQYVEENRQIH